MGNISIGIGIVKFIGIGSNNGIGIGIRLPVFLAVSETVVLTVEQK